MLKVYGMPICSGCVEFKANLDYYGLEYEFCDISASIQYMREFLTLRDTEAVFEGAKKEHRIGIPACIKDDGTVFNDYEGYLKELGYEVIDPTKVKACSIDGKNC